MYIKSKIAKVGRGGPVSDSHHNPQPSQAQAWSWLWFVNLDVHVPHSFAISPFVVCHCCHLLSVPYSLSIPHPSSVHPPFVIHLSHICCGHGLFVVCGGRWFIVPAVCRPPS